MSIVGRWAIGEIDIEPRSHPAKFSTSILLAIDHIVTEEADRLGRRLMIIDPFGGTGRAHRMGEAGHRVVVFELEPEWAIQSEGPTVVGDSSRLACRDDCVDVVLSSPVYGNRASDAHDAKDACLHRVNVKDKPPRQFTLADCPKCKGSGLTPRNTYRHQLQRRASVGSTTPMPWGSRYRQIHARIMAECLRPLRSEGLVVWNTSNHLKTVDVGGVKSQVEQRVNEWFCNEWMALGCNLVEARRVPTRRNRNGQNAAVRVDGELVLVMRAPAKTAQRTLPLGAATLARSSA